MFSVGPQELILLGVVVLLLLGLPLAIIFLVLFFIRRKKSPHESDEN